MAKFHGVIGYGTTVEGAAGVWLDSIVERTYYGDVIRPARRLQEGQEVNSELTFDNSISIVADAYAAQNFANIKYVQYTGTRWVVTKVEEQRPRLILRLGGVYNGPIGITVTP